MSAIWLPLSGPNTTLRLACRAPKCLRSFNIPQKAYRHVSATAQSTGPEPNSKPQVDDYYALLLEQPLESSTAQQRPVYVPPDLSSPPESSKPREKPDKASIIFGSKLVGPAMRQRYIEDLPSLQASGQGTYIAGVWVPPKPTEPDNCCMSGCVNCVWDGYREELGEWVKRRNSARKLAAKRRENTVADAAGRGDEDGVGSGVWSLESAMDEIPVGIREFMKTEKRLQQQRREAGV